MAFKKLVKCPTCRVPNRFGAAKCKICKNDLPQEETTRKAPDQVKKEQEPTRPTQPRDPPHTRAVKRIERPQRKEGSPPQRKGGKRRGPPPGRRAKPKKKPEQSAASKIVAWLCCDPLPPIPLGPKPTLTLGRSDECDLVLPHKEVSRVHALIKIRGKLIVYEDEGSSNGTFLNGRRISSSHLKVGDQLTLGPYEIEIRSNEDMAKGEEGDSAGSTKAFELTSRRSNPNAALSGNLREMPLAELLQALEFNKRSGTLTILTKKIKGTLVLKEGRPVTASFGELKDAQAILSMLTFNSGRFSLDGDEVDLKPTMTESLTSLLFEASRRLDEARRAAAEDETSV